MADHAYDVTVADFEEKVLAASQRVPVIVDFWAPWCQPCRILKPILEKLAHEYGGKFILAKVNSDENQELAQRYGVRGIPAIKAFFGGELADEFTGALPENRIREFLKRLIPSPAEPLRLEALMLAEKGDIAAARDRIAEAIRIDPEHDVAYLDFVELCLAADSLDEAEQILDTVAHRAHAQNRSRVESLQARLRLAQSGGSADVEILRGKLGQDPHANEARLQLANALALRHDYRGALEHLLELVRRDKKWHDEAGRKAMLDLFSLLAGQPQHEELVREFRIALARTLN